MAMPKWAAKQEEAPRPPLRKLLVHDREGRMDHAPRLAGFTGRLEEILAWIVRPNFVPAAASRGSFPREAAKVFRDLYPLLRFSSLPE